jgi:hypothetical protein
MSFADELKKLVELRDCGALTDDEFESQKKVLLDASASSGSAAPSPAPTPARLLTKSDRWTAPSEEPSDDSFFGAAEVTNPAVQKGGGQALAEEEQRWEQLAESGASDWDNDNWEEDNAHRQSGLDFSDVSRSRIAALVCVLGFFLPWAGFGISLSGYDILSFLLDAEEYTRALFFGAMPALALLGLVTDNPRFHSLSGWYAIGMLLFAVVQAWSGLDDLPSEFRSLMHFDLGNFIEIIKIGFPMAYGGAIAQMLMKEDR